jgi:hypothetical protein
MAPPPIRSKPDLLIRGDDRQVGGGEVVAEQVGGLDPRERDVLVGARLGRARGDRGYERNHFDNDGAVVVHETRQGSRDGNCAAEFLMDFADDGGGGILAGLDLAAGEFPFERQQLVRRALGEQHEPGAFDDGTDDGDGRRGGHGLWLNKARKESATILGLAGISRMKTFLKIALMVLLVVVAVKLSPLILLAALGGLLVAGVVGALGLSLVAVLLAVTLALAAVLSPIWVPGLLAVGIISLWRRHHRPATA